MGETQSSGEDATMWEEIERRAEAGAYVGAGWRPHVLAAHRHIEAMHPGYSIGQIKAKFGGLRYYCDYSGDPDVDEIITAAEERCSCTCERCGSTTNVTTAGVGGWLVTLCAQCRSADETARSRRSGTARTA